MHATQMIASHPRFHGHAEHALATCIETCFDCVQACTSCADACLGEDSVAQLAQCIRLTLDCADICAATGAIAWKRAADAAAWSMRDGFPRRARKTSVSEFCAIRI